MAGKEHVMARESGTKSSGVTEESNEDVMNQSQTVTPKIQKVPRFLRDYFVRQYEPIMVSFGPIHHQRGEVDKQILIADFVQASGKDLVVLCRQIRQIINQLRDCFVKEVTETYDDDTLALLLCKDGCAILQYICSRPTQKKYDVIAQDILLLENQIPYKVLKELMQLSVKKEELEKSIETFIEESVMVQLDEQSKKKAAKGNLGDNLPSQANPQRDVQIDGDHVHLLDLLRKSLLGISQAETRNKRMDLVLPSFHNVRELKAAGIHLRRSSDRFLSNISFRRRFHLLGRLYLPPITVDNSTRLKFLNLVAYEICADFENDPGVISYLCFLYSLIDGAQDVKELRDAGVLCSSHVSDTELQNFLSVLSEICVDLGPDPDTYIGVKEDIQEYYGTLMSKMLQTYHAYIKGSSWPLVAFWGVLLGLLFSVTETWFTVKTWFSVSPASQSHS